MSRKLVRSGRLCAKNRGPLPYPWLPARIGAWSAFLLLTLTSCGSTSLYYWGDKEWSREKTTEYEKVTYRHYKNHSPKGICSLILLYEEMITQPGGERKVPPPGICAEYAHLLSQPNTAEVFRQNATVYQKGVFPTTNYADYFPKRAKELYEMEMALYPECATFIKPLYEKLLSR